MRSRIARALLAIGIVASTAATAQIQTAPEKQHRAPPTATVTLPNFSHETIHLRRSLMRHRLAHREWKRLMAQPVENLVEQGKALIKAAKALLAVPIYGTGGCGPGPIHDMIVSAFGAAAGEALQIAARESGCNPFARNPSQASGIFQLMPFWWDGENSFGWVFDPFDAAANISHSKMIYDYQGGFCPAWC